MARRPGFAPAATRRAVVAGWQAVVTLVDAVPDAAFGKPTRLGDWTVAELVAHMAHNPTHIGRMLDAEPGTAAPQGWSTYYKSTEPDSRIAQRAVENAEGKSPAQLKAETRANTNAAVELLGRLSDDQILATPSSAYRLADYLPTRCVEACTHSLDLAAATGLDPGLDREALGVAARMLARVLAERVPGRSVELRIPPYAAVQCVAGPRHTRGTPPNVVEVEPVTWVELATGRLAWSDVVGTPKLRASGNRADLTAYLPVLS